MATVSPFPSAKADELAQELAAECALHGYRLKRIDIEPERLSCAEWTMMTASGPVKVMKGY